MESVPKESRMQLLRRNWPLAAAIGSAVLGVGAAIGVALYFTVFEKETPKVVRVREVQRDSLVVQVDYRDQAEPPAMVQPFIVRGYAFDTQATAGVPIEGVEVWRGLRETGQFLGRADYGLHHKDALVPNSGFEFRVSGLKPGCQTLYVYPVLGEGLVGRPVAYSVRVLSIPPQPTRSYTISIDTPKNDSTVDLPVVIWGWAGAFPSTEDAGVERVEVWNGPRESGYLVASAEVGIYRSDVGKSRGVQYTNSGYSAVVRELPRGETAILHLYAVDSETHCYSKPQIIRVKPAGGE